MKPHSIGKCPTSIVDIAIDGVKSRYKATVRGYQTDDDAQIPEERKFVDAPTLVIISDQDYATRAEMAEQIAPARLRNFSIKKLTGCGHWIQLEKRDEFSEALVQFAVEVSGKV